MRDAAAYRWLLREEARATILPPQDMNILIRASRSLGSAIKRWLQYLDEPLGALRVTQVHISPIFNLGGPRKGNFMIFQTPRIFRR